MRFALTSFIFALFLFGCSDTSEPKPEAKESAPSADSSLSKGAALVLTLKGKVSVVSPSDVNGTAATENQFLSPGNSLVTDEDSEALLLLTNGTTLSVGANTTFELKAFYQDGFDAGKDKVGSLKEEASPSTVLIDLKVGDLVVDVKKLRKKSNFNISTPLGVAGIRGTSFRLIALAEATTLSVLTGRVDFVSPANESFQVEASQVILAPKGEDPKVSPLTDAEKQAIQEAVNKAREKADEVELETLKDGLGFKNHVVPSAANLEMTWVEPGTFMMGSPATEKGRSDDENQTQVTLTKGFYLGKFEVTQSQFQAITGTNSSKFNATNNGKRPVEEVNWEEAVAFCDKLTEQERNAGRLPYGWAYALPTEAEWEYACRAGTTTAYSWGDTITPRNANYKQSELGKTRDVGKYAPNQWGFHDMHGNVREWTNDPYQKDYSAQPISLQSVGGRVKRGGSFHDEASSLRCAKRTNFHRTHHHNHLGFRLALKKIETGLFASLHSVPSANDLEMIWVEPGTFMMGSPPTEKGREDDENQTQVTLTKGFYLGKYEVTQAQYETVMKGNIQQVSPSPSSSPNNPKQPVERVTWNNAQVFLSRLNANENAAGRLPQGWKYALPTEAEWEYACRAGTDSIFYWGNSASSKKANFNGTKSFELDGGAEGPNLEKPCDVGIFKPNPWGFFDMHGNVSELTQDLYLRSSDILKETGKDGFGRSYALYRTMRGGNWYTTWGQIRSANRQRANPESPDGRVGFRLALRKTN
jgi:formylglycine-generating enzyme required for sulfatase activity